MRTRRVSCRSPTHFKVKAQVRVCEMWTAGCLDEVCEGTTSPERSFVMGWPTCNCVATFRYDPPRPPPHRTAWSPVYRNRSSFGSGRKSRQRAQSVDVTRFHRVRLFLPPPQLGGAQGEVVGSHQKVHVEFVVCFLCFCFCFVM